MNWSELLMAVVETAFHTVGRLMDLVDPAARASSSTT
jgi:hypothetical protein